MYLSPAPAGPSGHDPAQPPSGVAVSTVDAGLYGPEGVKVPVITRGKVDVTTISGTIAQGKLPAKPMPKK